MFINILNERNYFKKYKIIGCLAYKYLIIVDWKLNGNWFYSRCYGQNSNGLESSRFWWKILTYQFRSFYRKNRKNESKNKRITIGCKLSI